MTIALFLFSYINELFIKDGLCTTHITRETVPPFRTSANRYISEKAVYSLVIMKGLPMRILVDAYLMSTVSMYSDYKSPKALAFNSRCTRVLTYISREQYVYKGILSVFLGRHTSLDADSSSIVVQYLVDTIDDESWEPSQKAPDILIPNGYLQNRLQLHTHVCEEVAGIISGYLSDVRYYMPDPVVPLKPKMNRRVEGCLNIYEATQFSLDIISIMADYIVDNDGNDHETLLSIL